MQGQEIQVEDTETYQHKHIHIGIVYNTEIIILKPRHEPVELCVAQPTQDQILQLGASNCQQLPHGSNEPTTNNEVNDNSHVEKVVS